MQRCRAKSKRSGEQCKNYAVKGWSVCRMHGARGGPKTKKGKFRCKTAPLKHGYYCKEAIEERRQNKNMMEKAKETLRSINSL
jgi:hypothetical protein